MRFTVLLLTECVTPCPLVLAGSKFYGGILDLVGEGTFMKVHCEACDCEGEFELQGIAAIEDGLPQRWRRRIIDNRAYILCDICGHPRQFLGALSPYIVDALRLQANASCEVSERADFF